MKDAYIHLLMDCNNDCLFCSVPKKKIYLSVEDVKKRIDRYHKKGFQQVTFTGGEPTLHEDLIQAVSYVHTKGMECRIITNGTKLNWKVIKNLEYSGLNYICLSVHTLDAEKAKYISDNKDYCLDDIFTNMDYILNKTSIKLYINITISKLNYKDLPEMAILIVKRFKKVHLVNFNYVDVWGNVLMKKMEDKIAIPYHLSELYVLKALNILKKNKINFRAERIPLCYLVGFEKYSSDYNRIIEAEKPITLFTDEELRAFTMEDYEKGEACNFCFYKKICCGVNVNYNNKFGTKDLYPIFHELR